MDLASRWPQRKLRGARTPALPKPRRASELLNSAGNTVSLLQGGSPLCPLMTKGLAEGRSGTRPTLAQVRSRLVDSSPRRIRIQGVQRLFSALGRPARKSLDRIVETARKSARLQGVNWYWPKAPPRMFRTLPSTPLLASNQVASVNHRECATGSVARCNRRTIDDDAQPCSRVLSLRENTRRHALFAATAILSAGSRNSRCPCP